MVVLEHVEPEVHKRITSGVETVELNSRFLYAYGIAFYRSTCLEAIRAATISARTDGQTNGAA